MFSDVSLMDCRTAQDTQLAMGTVMAYHIHGANAQACLEAVQAEIFRLDGLLSRFNPGSEISRINRSAGRQSEPVSFTTTRVLEQAREACAACAGYFDPTIGPLSALWNIGRATFAVPEAAAIQAAKGLVDYRDMVLDPVRGRAGLRRCGQSLDLGGIGKGFAADQVMDILREYGIRSATANLGGNVVAWGARPDGLPWQVGIQHPRLEGELVGAVSVRDEFVVTSGDYQRYGCDGEGKRFHHILSPASGYPADSDLQSVTVVAGSGVWADVFSTSLFAAGKEAAVQMLRSQPGIESVLVDCDGQVGVTVGLAQRFRGAEGVRVEIIK